MEQPWAQNGMLGVRHAVIATLPADQRVTNGDEDSRLRQDLDLDSLDFLRLVETIDTDTGVDIPERGNPPRWLRSKDSSNTSRPAAGQVNARLGATGEGWSMFGPRPEGGLRHVAAPLAAKQTAAPHTRMCRRPCGAAKSAKNDAGPSTAALGDLGGGCVGGAEPAFHAAIGRSKRSEGGQQGAE